MRRAMIVSDLTERDLKAALASSQEHHPTNVQRFVDEVRAALADIQEAPLRWPTWHHSGFRRDLLPRLPYAFYYRVDDRTVFVDAFLHHHQDASRRFPEDP
jgi:plasmid stabilization system protein ParE